MLKNNIILTILRKIKFNNVINFEWAYDTKDHKMSRINFMNYFIDLFIYFRPGMK